MWSSCLSGFSAVLRAAISGRWGHCVTLRQVGLPCFPPLKPSCLQGVLFARPNLGEGSFDLLQKKWMQLEEFLLACKTSRKIWETFGHMMKAMTRSHPQSWFEAFLGFWSVRTYKTSQLPVSMQWLANRCQNGTHKPAISCAAQCEAKDLFEPDVLDVLGLLALRFVRRSWQHVRICRNPWAIEPRLVTKIWGCDGVVSLAPFVLFWFVLFFISLFVLFCFLSLFVFLFVCVGFVFFFFWGGGGWFGLVWFCLFVCLVGWLAGWLFGCLVVWLFVFVWLCWFVFAVKQKETCAQSKQNRSQIILNFFVHATNTTIDTRS